MLDDKEISKAVVKFFEVDVPREQMLVRSATSITSPQFDGMPGKTSNGNGSENKMISYTEAKRNLAAINTAFDLMDPDEADVLNLLMIKHETATKAAMELCLSRASVFRLRKRALVDFAYAYNCGELLDRLHDKETA